VFESEGKPFALLRRSKAPECTELRRAETVEDTRDVEDRGDVRTVVAVAQLRRKIGPSMARSLRGARS